MRGTGALDASAVKAARTVEVEVSSVEEFLRAFEWEEQRDDAWKHPTMDASCPLAMAFVITMRTIIDDATGKAAES